MHNPINEVRPLKAWHYNPAKVKDISRCLTPPYDVISPEMQEDFYRKDPYNYIRLILNKEEPADNPIQNRYTRAHDFLNQWKTQEILIQSHTPAFWGYEMAYALPGASRRKVSGIIGLVKLADFDEMRILPHEKILKTAYEDRMKLTREINTQLEYIWGIYQDRDLVIDQILEKQTAQPAIINHREEATGVCHQLRQLTNEEHIKQISQVFRQQQIYIADGHHRYNTMLAIRNALRQEFPAAGPEAPWEYILMFLTNTQQAGLTVFPTHRMVYGLALPEQATLLRQIEAYFEIQHQQESPAGPEARAAHHLLEKIQCSSPGQYRLGLYLPGGHSYILTLKDPAACLAEYAEEYSRVWKLLDVNILNTLLLKKILGISEEQLAMNTNLRYTVDPREAIALVESGRMQLAFLLNPTALKDVIAVSNQKEMMPRKSTYFYPKPVSGLVMYEMV